MTSSNQFDAFVAQQIAAAVAPVADRLTAVSAELAALKAAEAAATRGAVIEAAIADAKITLAQRPIFESQYNEAPSVVTTVLASMAPGTAFRASRGDAVEQVDESFWASIQPPGTFN